MAQEQSPFPPGKVLVVTPSVPAVRDGNSIVLDDKAVSGLMLFKQFWRGPVRCIFREGPIGSIAFGSRQNAELPFEVITLPKGSLVPDALLRDAAVVLASGDNYLDLDMAHQCRELNVPIAFIIEYTLVTRLQIIALSEESIFKKIKSIVWTIKTEMHRRRAFSLANALQANGTPSADAYASINPRIFHFFDTRLSSLTIASDKLVEAKKIRRMTGNPLQLVYSGRLERMKGVDHLVPLAERLVAKDISFQFNIFGSGSLYSKLKEAESRTAFAGKLVVHGPVNFESVLVPWMKNKADLFVCCHPQSDPSCTYMETLGCGVPIVGYCNRAIEGLVQAADVGTLVKIGDVDGLADQIAMLAKQPEIVAIKARNAITLAQQHNFETTFAARIAQLESIAAH